MNASRKEEMKVYVTHTESGCFKFTDLLPSKNNRSLLVKIPEETYRRWQRQKVQWDRLQRELADLYNSGD